MQNVDVGGVTGVSVLLNAAAGSIHDSPKITKAALEVLHHCVANKHRPDCILHPYPNISRSGSARVGVKYLQLVVVHQQMIPYRDACENYYVQKML